MPSLLQLSEHSISPVHYPRLPRLFLWSRREFKVFFRIISLLGIMIYTFRSLRKGNALFSWKSDEIRVPRMSACIVWHISTCAIPVWWNWAQLIYMEIVYHLTYPPSPWLSSWTRCTQDWNTLFNSCWSRLLKISCKYSKLVLVSQLNPFKFSLTIGNK
jgi:hypothetical protein